MASYELLIAKSAAHELEALPKKDRQRVATKIQTLATDPRPHGSEKLTGYEHYRIRQGNYRIVYSIDDPAQKVTIIRIAHRGEVYRKL